MYETYYGLSEKPFNLTPDPRYLFLSEKHREAFAHLLFGIKNRSGFVMVTGEIGTGKTTICRTLLGQLDDDVCLAFIFNPILNSIELLKKILREFGATPTGTNVLELTEELNAFLLEAAAEGKNCVLVVDEAQNLTPPVLEQIRLLSNLETEREKLIQIILIGQPELGELLSLRELRQLNQRITARYHLKALDETETAQYVAHRMHVAGGRKKPLFDKRAIKLIYKYSGGTPRVINSLCDRSLLIGYTKEKTELDGSVVQQALEEIRGEKFAATQGQPTRWQWLRRLAPSPSLVVLAVTAVLIVQLLSGSIDRLTSQLAQFRSEDPPTAAPTTGSPPKAEAVATPPSTEITPASAEPARNTAASSPETGIDNWFDDTPDAAARREAVAALMKLWGIDAAPGAVGPAADDIRRAFSQQGLALEDFEPSLSALHALNLPALVLLNTAAGPVWAALLRCDNEKATLLIDGTPREVALDKLRAHYVGRALVPWKPNPALGDNLLRPGMRGAAVAALRGALYEAGKLDERGGETYDKTLELAVRDLQEETGLIVDGLAGCGWC